MVVFAKQQQQEEDDDAAAAEKVWPDDGRKGLPNEITRSNNFKCLQLSPPPPARKSIHFHFHFQNFICGIAMASSACRLPSQRERESEHCKAQSEQFWIEYFHFMPFDKKNNPMCTRHKEAHEQQHESIAFKSKKFIEFFFCQLALRLRHTHTAQQQW